MTEQPTNIAREARGLHQGLKELLKDRDPWDKEVEFQRKNLRKHYLSLLLVHPYAKESKDAETHLWMQTSYNIISLYKQRIHALDRAIQMAPHQQGQQPPRHGGHGPVEYRKLLQRFRQFLADEEKFWTQFLVRFHRGFGLDEVQRVLDRLGIVSSMDSNGGIETSENGQATSGGRNHFQFPPGESVPSMQPSESQLPSRCAIFSKALVCLGDIARYRELYSEGGNKPKAGSNDTTIRKGARRGRGGVLVNVIPQAKNYDKARDCYEQARLLVPEDGNPSHQLAILASYRRDIFSSLVHYYHALCVRDPYETASENLGKALAKALEQWNHRHKVEGGNDVHDKPDLPPIAKVDSFKEDVVVLHALWRRSVQKMDALAPHHADRVINQFQTLVMERHLLPDIISQVVVLSQGALWNHTMIRDTSPQNKTPDPSKTASYLTIEIRILAHILSIHRALFEVGTLELAEPSQDEDLAQRITAVFRRTLPALRIAGKWLKANFKYVINKCETDPTTQGEDGDSKKDPIFFLGRHGFWSSYAHFYCALSRTFPEDKLPALTMLLDEDTEMSAFLPLQKTMGPKTTGSTGVNDWKDEDVAQASEQVHPNVEYLMRIADLLADAKEIVEKQDSPIAIYGNRYVVKGVEATNRPLEANISQLRLMDEIRNEGLTLREGLKIDDDTMTETTSRTDDDPIRDAFDKVLGGSNRSDEDEDEIVWDPRATTSPRQAVLPSPPSHLIDQTPIKLPMSPICSPSLPTHSKTNVTGPAAKSPLPTTTAQDLLQNISLSRPAINTDTSHTFPQPMTPSSTSQFLFGSPHKSIWSTSIDDPFMGKANNSMYQSHPQNALRASQLLSPPSWTSSQTLSTQNSQVNIPGALPSASFAPSPHISSFSGHQRVHSASLSPSHLYGNRLASLSGLGSSRVQHLSHLPDDLYTPGQALYSTPQITSSIGFHDEGSGHGYHNRHLSLTKNDPRTSHVFAPPSLSQSWGNAG